MKYFNKRKQAVINLFYPLFKILGFFLGKKLWAKKDKYNSILVVDLHMIGDIVMLIPLLKELKNKYPESNLSLLSGSWAPVVLKELNIDNFFILDAPWVKSNTISSWLNLFRTIVKLRKFKWELTIDVRGDLRNSLIINLIGGERRVGYDFMHNGFFLNDIVQYKDYLHLADFNKGLGVHLDLFDNKFQYIPLIESLPKIKSKKKVIGIHFGASLPLRTSNLEVALKWLDEIIDIHDDECTFLVFELPERINFSEQLYDYLKEIVDVDYWKGGLAEFREVLKECDHLYCFDSGPAHIGAAFGKNVSIIFGPTSPINVGPIGHNVKYLNISEKPSCWPCAAIFCSNPKHQECFNDSNIKLN